MGVVRCALYSQTDHWSVCPHVVKPDEETVACRWLPVDGRNSLRYDLPYTLYVSAVNALGRASSAPITIDTTGIGIRYNAVLSRSQTTIRARPTVE